MNCRKCNTKIPSRITIDGRIHSLQHRVFCLQCSPFKGHNTKTDDPSRPTKTDRNWGNWTEEKKLRHIARVCLKGIERKEKIIEMSGGSCLKCKYKSNCLRAFSFHHRNPKDKKFELSISGLRQHKWDEILTEVKKCDILCVRCHAEVEDELSIQKFGLGLKTKDKWSKILQKIGAPINKSSYCRREKVEKTCKFCNKIFSTKNHLQKYCSLICSSKSTIKTVIPKEVIIKMRSNGDSWRKIGLSYGVGRNAARKWAVKYELYQ